MVFLCWVGGGTAANVAVNQQSHKPPVKTNRLLAFNNKLMFLQLKHNRKNMARMHIISIHVHYEQLRRATFTVHSYGSLLARKLTACSLATFLNVCLGSPLSTFRPFNITTSSDTLYLQSNLGDNVSGMRKQVKYEYSSPQFQIWLSNIRHTCCLGKCRGWTNEIDKHVVYCRVPC